MNLEQLAYVNQQLAAMLRDGLPLEGALRDLATSLRDGQLRGELVALEADLAAGRPLADAVSRRQFPPLYNRLLVAGARSGDLPGALTMAADHYGDIDQRRLRLRALMVYPALVILVGLVMTGLIAWVELSLFRGLFEPQARTGLGRLTLWIIPASFALFATLGVILALVAPLRRWLGWRLPGFRENRVANLSGAVGLMVRQHCPLPDALALARELEQDPRVRSELSAWLERIARGEPPLAGPAGRTVLPALLPWLARSPAGQLGDGFLRASQFYHRRAMHRLDLLVNGALPLSLVLLGAVTGTQLFFVLRLLANTVVDTLAY